MMTETLTSMIQIIPLLLIIPFYKLSPASTSAKVESVLIISGLVAYLSNPDAGNTLIASAKASAINRPIWAAILAIGIGAPLKYLQHKLRFSRINGIKMKYGYTDDPETWENMTVEQAQEIESNMAEWEFPRLFQFGWISDFLRTSTDPGVSRAIISSAHIVNSDPMVEHERLQATIHMMTAFAAYKVKSPYHSLVIARINAHHHRYGTKINSDDVLYLMIHFAFAPVPWINRFGYRQLEAFEIEAMYVSKKLQVLLACRMGVKYIPKNVDQAFEWRKNFEKTFRWREDANETMAMAMLNQIIYPIPTPLHPFARKLVVSILDWDIVYYCQMEWLGPSALLRGITFDVFRLCGWLIREFGLPRLSPYKRSPDTPNSKTGLINFGHTPYDTLPFYLEPSLWNMWGPGALLRRIRGMPLPGPKYFSGGIAFESMGAAQKFPDAQIAVEKKVRDMAAVLEKAPYGYRPAIGFQANRLLPPVNGPTYGSDMNTFAPSTPLTPASAKRFDREYERRGLGYSKIDTIEKPEDIFAFNSDEAYGYKTNGLASAPVVSVSA